MRTLLFFLGITVIDLISVYFAIEIKGVESWGKLAAAVLLFCVVLDVVYAARGRQP